MSMYPKPDLPLFDAAPPPPPDANLPGQHRRDAPPTSKRAAYQIKTGTARGRILEALGYAGMRGLTDADMQRTLGILAHSQVPRRSELVTMGYVKASGSTDKLPTGRDAIVWQITRSGRSALLAMHQAADTPRKD